MEDSQKLLGMVRPSTRKSTEKGSGMMQKSYLSKGTVLQNRYKIDSIMSVTGLGHIYEAADLRFTGNRWIVKVYRKYPTHEFFEAMEALSVFHHPHLAKVVDFFEEGDFSCLVMERVHGRSLEEILEETVGPLPERQVLSWGVQCADALIYLHRQKNFKHYRNFSPRKILISTIGELKLIPPLPHPLEKTTTPGIMGYAPPEAFDEHKTPDEKSDEYALAAILHRCLAGGNPSAIPFVFVPLGPVNPTLESAIEPILERATQPNPMKRYPSLSDFRKEVYRCLQAILNLSPYRSRRKPASDEFWWTLMAVSTVALVVEAYVLYVFHHYRL